MIHLILSRKRLLWPDFFLEKWSHHHLHFNQFGVSKNKIWVFPKIGVPKNGWFIMENPIKMDDLRYHYFRKHPYVWDHRKLRNLAVKGSPKPLWYENMRSLPEDAGFQQLAVAALGGILYEFLGLLIGDLVIGLRWMSPKKQVSLGDQWMFFFLFFVWGGILGVDVCGEIWRFGSGRSQKKGWMIQFEWFTVDVHI